MPCGSNLEIALAPIRRVIKKDASDSVAAEDVIHLDVRMLPVLQGGQMLEILRRELKDAGWKEEPDGSLTSEHDGVVAKLLPDGSAVEVSRKVTSSVSATSTLNVREGDDDAKAESSVDAALQQQLEQKKKAEKERLDKQNLEALTKAEPEIRAKLQEALNKTYRKALEARAREIGELESLKESGDARGTYEVTVVVKAGA